MLLKSLKYKVESCLDIYPEARNCDKRLFNAIILNFYKEYTVDVSTDLTAIPAIRLVDIYKVPSFDHISRVRRKIQNPNPAKGYKGKYPPTDKDVLKRRGWMEEDIREFLGYNKELRKVYE